MKKYYDLVGKRLVSMLDWEKGYGTLEQAKKYFNCEIREITKKEFDKLGKEYSNRK